ncbi:MAG: hypothetical protein CM15mP58_07160 [Burkholderiaceae bacterium]|nr:MAG: hypothetical protein CM15mP58_07160 [Burkholderiaceae bacterium]
MKSIVVGGEIIEALRDRVLGRVTVDDIINPETKEILVEAGNLLDERLVNLIEKFGVDEVKVRSPLSCETRYGLCAKCYGRDLGRGSLVNVGNLLGSCSSVNWRARYAVNHENFPHWRSGI